MKQKDFDNNIAVWKKLYGLDEKTIEALRADLLTRVDFKYNRLTALAGKPWFIRLMSIAERMLTHGMSQMFEMKDQDFVLLACADSVNRVKTLPLIVKSFNYSVLFLPTLTRPLSVRNFYKYYKEKHTMDVFFGTFSREVVAEYRRFIRKNKSVFNEVKCEDEDSAKILLYVMKRFALYSIYAKHILEKSKKGVLWLFEHDKFYFIPVINEFRKLHVMTSQMLHGTFFNPLTARYIPIYTDRMICSSEREKRIFEEFKEDGNHIYVTGAPLQTLREKKSVEVPLKYDMLILMTATLSHLIEKQKKALTYINEHFSDQKILARFRPASAETDKANLAEYTKGYAISEGTSLMEDLCSAKKVVTFSEDTIFEILRAEKPFVAIVNKDDMYGNYLDGICCTTENMGSCLKELFMTEELHDMSKYLRAFGETDPEKIKGKFEKVIIDLKVQNEKF